MLIIFYNLFPLFCIVFSRIQNLDLLEKNINDHLVKIRLTNMCLSLYINCDNIIFEKETDTQW